MNIFIAKLSSSTTSDDLESLFTQFGEVTSAKVITDRDTGNSKCFGFVEMSDDSAAEGAVEKLDGSEYQGKTIAVKKAHPRESNGGGQGGGYNRGGQGGRSSGGGYNRGGQGRY